MIPAGPAQTTYESEIRDYLLGRLSKGRAAGPAPLSDASLGNSRILDWWVFEGKRYRGLQRPLAWEWHAVARQVRRLMGSYNPRWRSLQLPEGDVDWFATALEMRTSGRPEYVCRSSHLGLGADEATALAGWQRWIARRWDSYVTALGPPSGTTGGPPWPSLDHAPEELRQLKRWAFVARRSRWPFLRSVVAESLRAVFEPQGVDQLPLPTNPAALFELLCLVRVLRTIDPDPKKIRWLDRETTENTIRIPGVSCHYQRHIDRSEMLATSEFEGGLREAMWRHQLRTPAHIDGLLVFDQPLRGFQGILIEAKSGAQDPSAAIFQLKCYRAALHQVIPGPMIVWGVAEQAVDCVTVWDIGPDHVAQEDLWLFSSADEIEPLATRLLGRTATATAA